MSEAREMVFFDDRITELEEELAEWKAEVEMLREANDKLGTEREELGSQVADLQDQLADALSAKDDLEEELEVHKVECPSCSHEPVARVVCSECAHETQVDRTDLKFYCDNHRCLNEDQQI